MFGQILGLSLQCCFDELCTSLNVFAFFLSVVVGGGVVFLCFACGCL